MVHRWYHCLYAHHGIDMFEFIKTLFVRHYPTGVCEDPRSVEQKACDYLHEERVPAPVPDPFSNARITTSPYPYENQVSTSSCVPHGVGLALGIERELDKGHYVRLAPLFIYRQRTNYPAEGSWPQEIFSLYRKYGAPLYETLPTEKYSTERQANGVVLTTQMYTEAEIFRGDEYFMLEEPKDFEEIAKIAQQGHGVPILIYARYAEWARLFPIVESFLNLIGAPVRHCVCVLPRSGHWYNNERYITVQDSAWFGGYKLRHLSESFIKARCYGAGYWDTVKFIGAGERPKYTFTKILKVGAQSEEVKMVQKLLIAEGLLPTDMASGYFGGRTLAAVRAFQNKHSDRILRPLGLDAPTDTWGSMCIAVANEICKKDK